MLCGQATAYAIVLTTRLVKCYLWYTFYLREAHRGGHKAAMQVCMSISIPLAAPLVCIGTAAQASQLLLAHGIP